MEGSALKTKKIKLILGHAGKQHDDALTLDIDSQHNPDVVHDLNTVPYPFKDNQFEIIVCHHVLEHLNDLPPVMDELYRICSPQGEVCIEVPHHSSWMADVPEHKLRFNYFAFDGYIKDGTNKWLLGKKYRCLKKEITFHRRFRRLGLHKLFNRYPKEYESFWKFMCPAEHLKVTLQPLKD